MKQLKLKNRAVSSLNRSLKEAFYSSQLPQRQGPGQPKGQRQNHCRTEALPRLADTTRSAVVDKGGVSLPLLPCPTEAVSVPGSPALSKGGHTGLKMAGI